MDKSLKFDWVDKDVQDFLIPSYIQNQTVEERYLDIAKRFEEISGIEGWAQKWIEYFSKGWTTMSSPIISNLGKDTGLPASCNMLDIQDTLESIAYGEAEMMLLAKNGAGTARNFSKVRAKGKPYGTGGQSVGVMSWIRHYANKIYDTSQGGMRKGFFTAGLSVDHPEIMDFLTIGREGSDIKRITTYVTIPKGWMEDMLGGDEKKYEIFVEIHESRAEKGYPYILFEDNANKGKSEVYKDKWLTNTNICVTGDQRVVTDRGILTAKELYENGEGLVLFNGEKPVLSTPMKLMENNAGVYKISLENGMSHTVTAYHKVYVQKSRYKSEDVICSDLKVGDKVHIQTNKGLFGRKDAEKEAFLLGLWQSDGCRSGNSIQIDIWENDFDLVDEINNSHQYLLNKYSYKERYSTRGGVMRDESQSECFKVKKKRLSSDLYSKIFKFEKGKVPYWIFEGNEKTQWQYIRGLLYADGTAFKGKKTSKLLNEPIEVSYTDTNIEFLKELQIVFTNLGLSCNIYKTKEAGMRLMPDGKGGKKEYNCKSTYKLCISNYNDALAIEKNTGFLSRKGIEIEDRVYRDNTKKTSKIKSIEYIGEEDVYCVTTSEKSHHWVVNGFITHNCSECLEYTDEFKEFLCVLLSVNLEKWDEWKNTDFIFDCNLALDCVITEYIEKARNMRGLEKSVRFAEEHRAIGIGAMGWHSLLMKESIVYGSMEAHMLNNQIFGYIRRESDKASRWMAKEWGEPKMLKGTGWRNTSRMALAPTKSTSNLLKVTEGGQIIESNFNTLDLARTQRENKNKHLIPVLQKYGKDTEEVWNSILEFGGSVQHLDFLTQHEKDVFKISTEVGQLDHIKMFASRVKYFDQSMSMNLTIPSTADAEEVMSLTIEAWLSGLKTMYYQHNTNMAREATKSLLTCTSCEA